MDPSTPDGPPPALTLQPIGVVRSPFRDKHSAPRQPDPAAATEGTVELFPLTGYRDGLLDIERWSHIWLLFWFHHSAGWKPHVYPPRSAHKRGVFATRAPHRPNPIGMSVLRLVRVDGLVLHVRDLDLLDGTPVLDIKPYVPYADARVEANSGWLDPALAPRDPGPSYSVHFSERAQEQLNWLAPQLSFDLGASAVQALALGPTQHAYRRIRREGDHYRIAIRDFRLRFAVQAQVIEVLELATGYRKRILDDPAATPTAQTPLEVHRAFVARFGPRAAK